MPEQQEGKTYISNIATDGSTKFPIIMLDRCLAWSLQQNTSPLKCGVLQPNAAWLVLVLKLLII